MFDDNDDHVINFHEFAAGFSVLSPKATPDEKLKCMRVLHCACALTVRAVWCACLWCGIVLGPGDYDFVC